MRTSRCPLPPSLALLLLLAAAGAARAQDEPAADPAPGPEPPAVDVPPPAPAGDRPVETTERWYAFSRALAARMAAKERVPDAIEELLACAALRGDDLDSVADGAVLSIDYGTRVAHGLDPESPHVRTAEHLLRVGIARGGREKGDARLAYVAGRLNLLAGRTEFAANLFQEALAEGYDIDRLRPWMLVVAIRRAPELLRQGRADEVIRGLESLTAELPRHPDIVNAKGLLAAAYRQVGDAATSQRILDGLARDLPDDHRVLAVVGHAQLEQEQFGPALGTFQRVLDLSGSDREAYGDALISIALALHRLGRAEEAEQAARAFQEVQGDSVRGLHLLATLAHERGDGLEALRLLRRADRISGGAPPVLVLLETVLRDRGETDEADAVRARLEQRSGEPAPGEQGAGPSDDPPPR